MASKRQKLLSQRRVTRKRPKGLWLGARLGLYNLRLVNGAEELRNRSPLEMRVARMLSPYREYLQQDVRFDDSTACSVLARHRVEPPVIDDRELERFLELAWFPAPDGPLPAAHGSAIPAI